MVCQERHTANGLILLHCKRSSFKTHLIKLETFLYDSLTTTHNTTHE